MTYTYPLQWPIGWPKTEPGYHKAASFKVGYTESIRQLAAELQRFGADSAYLSTDRELRLDGQPRADRNPITQGAAVYFSRNGKQLCIPCDGFNSLRDNVRAIVLSIESLRRLERYGTSQMVEAALTGFAALPANATESNLKAWHVVLGVSPDAPPEVITAAYRALSKTAHPDGGGTIWQWEELRTAYEQSGAAS